MAGMEGSSGHTDHEDSDNTPKPCCSACGPMLAGGENPLQIVATILVVPSVFTLRELPRRDLLRLYEATGPPLRV